MTYYLRLLGGRPELWSGDKVFKQLQPLVLLAYLERRTGPQSRLAVANLFWPNLVKEKRLARLSEVLRVIDLEAPGVLHRTQDDVTLDTNVGSDIRELYRAIDDEEYALAAELYQGHFLENLESNQRLKLEEAPALYDWLLGEREALLDVARDGVLRHAEQKAAQGQFETAAGLALKAFAMRSEQSLLVPDDYLRIHTLLLSHDSARAAQITGEAHRLFGSEGLEFTKTVAEAQSKLEISGNLPLTPDTLFGREAELAECSTYLRTGGRLLVLTGPPGIGKTRFALELGRQLSGYRPFKGGIYWVGLESLRQARDVKQELARTLHVNLPGERDAKTVLVQAIGDQRILLILDNFEDALEATPLLDVLLEACPHLMLIITSRSHLNSEWARHVELGGLAFPTGRRTLSLEQTLEYPALALFANWAEQSSDTKLSEAILPGVQTLVETLGGLPLALKLAAGWLETVGLETLLKEIRSDLGFLTPEEPRVGIQEAIDISYQRLETEHQEAFCRLAVMAAPFTAETAREITGTSLKQLRRLQRRSLLSWDKATGRYSFHPLIRQHVGQKLKETREEKTLSERHAQYYLARLSYVLETAPGERDALYTALEAEVQDLEQAWRWALAEKQLEHLEEVAYSFCMVCHRAAYLEEGLALIEAALEATEDKTAYPMLSATKGWFLYLLGHYTSALEVAEEGLELASQGSNTRAKQLCLETLGAGCGSLGCYEESARYFEQVLELVPQNSVDAATMYMNLGISQTRAGLYKKAGESLEKARTLFVTMKASQKAVSAEFNLGVLFLAEGKAEKARNFLSRALDQADALTMTYWLPRIRLVLAEAELQVGRQEVAQQLTEEALGEAQLSRRKLLEGDALLLLAHCALKSQEVTETNKFLRQAISIFSEYGDGRRLLTALLVLVDCLHSQSNHVIAEKVLNILFAFEASMTATEQKRLSEHKLEGHTLNNEASESRSDLEQVVRRALVGTPFAF